MKCKFVNFVLSIFSCFFSLYVLVEKKMVIGTMLELILLCYLSSEI